MKPAPEATNEREVIVGPQPELRVATDARHTPATLNARRKLLTALDGLIGLLVESIEDLERDVLRVSRLVEQRSTPLRQESAVESGGGPTRGPLPGP